MIPKREWDAYNRSVDGICSRAESSAVRAVLAAVCAGSCPAWALRRYASR